VGGVYLYIYTYIYVIYIYIHIQIYSSTLTSNTIRETHVLTPGPAHTLLTPVVYCGCLCRPLAHRLRRHSHAPRCEPARRQYVYIYIYRFMYIYIYICMYVCISYIVFVCLGHSRIDYGGIHTHHGVNSSCNSLFERQPRACSYVADTCGICVLVCLGHSRIDYGGIHTHHGVNQLVVKYNTLAFVVPVDFPAFETYHTLEYSVIKKMEPIMVYPEGHPK